MRHDWRPLRTTLSVIVSLLLATLAAIVATPSPASSAPGSASVGKDKIRPQLSTQLENRESVDFWIYFDEKPDLAKAGAVPDWDERGVAVVKALKQTARESQQGVRQELAAAGVDFETFWATNAIKVRGGTQDLAEQLAAQVEVDSLWPTFTVTPPETKPSLGGHSANTVEWGIANINADEVWDQYGDTGEGIVIANIDSGVQFDHPALVGQYRGNNGDGTFDHNYNWYDAAGTCAGAPCDRSGHGTHTMGTMVGDDGGGNQVGVAPGATWIAANGCCPSDDALIRSGEWMLAPRDLTDDPATADPAKRPNIINNSWGTELPSNEPFMEDISANWTAAGIFGVWSNGNNGSSCRTSGSPGSRAINYSVGAYDVNDTIAEFSSRGTGQDGEIKPNISAPGVDVRSSVPGNGYASYNGTSMAAPHVAGTIALLWSASPGLAGDVSATRDLLDGTAVDHPDDQCGGTAADNNVYGEGDLDALALIEGAPTGDTGTLIGTVTNAKTGQPVSGATVTISGALDREFTTTADGRFDTVLPAGDYEVTVSAYRYQTQTRTVTVAAGENTLDLALDSVDTVTIRGQVLDGSGHGWPLYAKVSLTGEADLSAYTNPNTGRYAIEVPTNTTWQLEVESVYDGYQTTDAQVAVGSRNVVNDVDLPVDATSCVAAGYEMSDLQPVLSQSFDSEDLPEGWSIQDEIGRGQTWGFEDRKSRGNRTGGEGGFAIMDSESFYLATQDTSLVTPALDLGEAESVAVEFNQDYRSYSKDTYADIDVSTDGGETWQTARSQTGESVDGPVRTTIPLPAAAGESTVEVRWHYGSSFGHYWEIDDVVVGTQTCDPVDAGLVLGQVHDRNTGDTLAGASVTDADDPEQAVTTVATPDDPALGDGFWWMVTTGGEHRLSSAASEYQVQTKRVSVQPEWVTPLTFRLAAGMLRIDKSEVRSTMVLGGTKSRAFTVTNDGTAPVEVELDGRDGSFEMLGGGAGTSSSLRQLDSAGAAATRAARAKPARTSAWTGSDPGSGFGVSGLEPGRSTLPVQEKSAADEITLTHSVSQELFVNSMACAGGGTTSAAGYLRVFDLEDFDIETDFAVKNVSFGVESARGAQQLTVRLYTLDGELVYDNLTPIGSAETTLEPQELTMVTVPVTGTAPAGSQLVVELDSPDLTALGGAFFPGSNDRGQTGPTYLRASECGVSEPATTDDLGFPQMHLVLNVAGEVDSSVPWLSMAPDTLSLAPGESTQVRVTMDGNVDQPGEYGGRIRLAEDTPYDTGYVGATMTITPPKTWGKLVGTVTGRSCGGATDPIADGTVQVDWWSGNRTLYTGSDGSYAYWLDRRGNPYTLNATKDGFRPLVRTLRIRQGEETTADFELTETRC